MAAGVLKSAQVWPKPGPTYNPAREGVLVTVLVINDAGRVEVQDYAGNRWWVDADELENPGRGWTEAVDRLDGDDQ